MGGCLSKSGKKTAKDDPDRAPYSPSESNRNLSQETKTPASNGRTALGAASKTEEQQNPVSVGDVSVEAPKPSGGTLAEVAASDNRIAAEEGDCNTADALLPQQQQLRDGNAENPVGQKPLDRKAESQMRAYKQSATAADVSTAAADVSVAAEARQSATLGGVDAVESVDDSPLRVSAVAKDVTKDAVIGGGPPETAPCVTQNEAGVAENDSGRKSPEMAILGALKYIKDCKEKDKKVKEAAAEQQLKSHDIELHIEEESKELVVKDVTKKKRTSIDPPSSVNIRKVSFSDDPARAMALARQGLSLDTSSTDVTEDVVAEETVVTSRDVTPPTESSPSGSSAATTPNVGSAEHVDIAVVDGNGVKLNGTNHDDTSSASDPVPIVNLKNKLKETLFDFSDRNKSMINQKEYVLNTRQKQFAYIQKWFGSAQKGDSGGGGHGNGVSSQIESNLLLVTGPAGAGKSCLSAELCRRYESRLAAYHFFDHFSVNLLHNDVRCALLSLASSFVDVFPHYVSTLPMIDKVEELVRLGSLKELFNTFIKNALDHPSLQHDVTQPVMLILDGLDEVDGTDDSVLLPILNDYTESCPPWLYIIVTARNSEQVINNLDKALKMELKCSQDLPDIKRYLKAPMSRFMDRISLDGGLAALAKNSGGSFLCAYCYRCALEKLPTKSVALRHVDDLLPSGLSALLTDHFTAFMDALAQVDNGAMTSRDMYQAILSPLVLANEPLPAEYLLDAVRMSFDQLKDTLEPISGFVVLSDNRALAPAHKAICEWLLDAPAPLKVDLSAGRDLLSRWCVKWLCAVLAEDGQSTEGLEEYSLKHVTFHLLEQPKRQEDLGRVLSSLRYIQQKLQTSNIKPLDIRHDFEHSHYVKYSNPPKKVTLSSYIARNAAVLEAVSNAYKFLKNKESEIAQSDGFLLQIAANYCNNERIQNNARAELAGRPWLSDLLSTPETKGKVVTVGGHIRGIDTSPDGRTLAVVSKDEEYNIKLHVLDAVDLVAKCPPIDIKTLKDRYGLVTKFMPEGGSIFVGSLSSFISVKGKVTPSSFDLLSVNMAEKYSIECCDVNSKHLVCGLTTFPWGGRSLHLTVFDLRSKKAGKTIEIVRFQYGGSGQFGVRSVALCREKPVMAACVRQSNKKQLKLTVWNTTKFHIIQSVDVFDEEITKSLFVGDESIVVGNSVRTYQTSKNEQQFVAVKSQIWSYTEKRASLPWDDDESNSVISQHGATYVCARWTTNSDAVSVQLWNSTVRSNCNSMFRIRGLHPARDMVFNDSGLIFVSADSLTRYEMADLESVACDRSGPKDIREIVVDGVSFLPRSDSFLVVERQDEKVTITTWDVAGADELEQVSPPLVANCPKQRRVSDVSGLYKCFSGPGSSLEACHVTSDGGHVALCTGESVLIWDIHSGECAQLPMTSQQNSDEGGRVQMVASPKDPVLAVVYQNQPENICLYDARTRAHLRTLTTASGPVSDLMFHGNGHLITYHRQPQSLLVTWSARDDTILAKDFVGLSYVKVSPTSDRLALSVRDEDGDEGHVVLRSSDLHFKVTLNVSKDSFWLPSGEQGDLEFASDGTVLIAVCQIQSICRVFNAANGDLLTDLGAHFAGPSEVLGMPTNTHALFYDQRLVALDVGTTDVVTVLPTETPLVRRASPRGLRLSPRGNLLLGAKISGHLCLYRLNHFSAIKRKTTLQRMKSMTERARLFKLPSEDK